MSPANLNSFIEALRRTSRFLQHCKQATRVKRLQSKSQIMCLTFAAAVLPATGNPIACSPSTAPKICIDVKNKLFTIHRKGRLELDKLDQPIVSR